MEIAASRRKLPSSIPAWAVTEINEARKLAGMAPLGVTGKRSSELRGTAKTKAAREEERLANETPTERIKRIAREAKAMRP